MFGARAKDALVRQNILAEGRFTPMSTVTSPTFIKKSPVFSTGDIGIEAEERDHLHRSLSTFVGGLIRNRIDLQFARKELDYVYISEVLRNNGGNIGQAAKMMGIHRNTLSKRIKELNIPVKNLPER